MLNRIHKQLPRLNINPLRGLRYLWHRLGNWRRGRARHLDYIWLDLPSSLPALPESRSWLRRRITGQPPLSLADLDRHLRQIGADPRPTGLILKLQGLNLSLADLQTLHNIILRLRDEGKRVIAYAQSYDNATYFIGSACDELILQPGGTVNPLGLVAQPTFLRNALSAIGIQLDSVAISPFKGVYDSLTLDSISPEGLEQLDWMLDSRFEMLVDTIAAGRHMSAAAVKNLIDTAPHLDDAALEKGYVDAVLHEEQLAEHLGTKHLVLWSDARKKLQREWQPRFDQYVAVLPLSGLMIPGESGGPPGDIPLPIPIIGSGRLGDRTVVRQVRNLLKNEQAAAVVLWVDSGGGVALAADAMTAALRELAKDRPLVVYMNGVAASGGYYIATPAHWIVAQPGTITGSIGVILGKPVTGELFNKLRINRMQFKRGANANIFSDQTPFNDAQRTQMRASIEHNYQQFIDYVAAGRDMTVEAVDAVGGGRVWTGKQALELGLVDELGDLKAAIAKARELAELPDHAPAALMRGKVKPLVPQVADSDNPAATLRYLYENLQFISRSAQYLIAFEWKDL